MPLYQCRVCNFCSSNKNKFNSHLKAKKHFTDDTISTPESNQEPKTGEKKAKVLPNGSKMPVLSAFFEPKCSEMLRNAPVFLNEPENRKIILFSAHKICEFCDKEFSKAANLKRHLKNSCKVKKKLEALEKEKEKIHQEREKERDSKIQMMEDHQKQINLLLTKVGNTTINNNCTTNNIQLNNFGQEDLTMLTDKYMRKMVIYPYTAIPKLIKKIHFNEKYPANQNIRMLNKKDNKLQIRNNNKWEFVDKKEALEQLISEKNYQLDKFYEDNREEFEDVHQNRFDSFQDKLNIGDKNAIKTVNTGSELIFWNNM